MDFEEGKLKQAESIQDIRVEKNLSGKV